MFLTARRVQVSDAVCGCCRRYRRPSRFASRIAQETPCAFSAPESFAMPAGGSQGFATGGKMRSMGHYAGCGMRYQEHSLWFIRLFVEKAIPLDMQKTNLKHLTLITADLLCYFSLKLGIFARILQRQKKRALDTPCTRLWPRLRKSRLRIRTRKHWAQVDKAD